MQVTDFDFDLPSELIAHYPKAQRSASRLLYLDRQTGALAHHQFMDLADLLMPGDLLVFNNTKVIPARLYGQKQSGGKIEVLVERVLSDKHLLAHIRANHAPKPGSELMLEDSVKAIVIERQQELFLLELQSDKTVFAVLEEIGHMPLPPYIERAAELQDDERYQTIYAEHKGAVAAPTAGLHFDERLFDKLEQRGIEKAFVTLHVGAGTFQPVRVQNIYEHVMHSEYLEVSQAVCDKIQATRARGSQVVAVGTTSVRCLETAARDGELKPYQGETDIFIYPGYEFRCIDSMVTNFHLPQSTLLMLIAAFAELEPVLNAYRSAVAEQYRFFSYGDAMLIG